MEQREFLIWRCARALRACVPFHDSLPGLSANGDSMSPFIGEKGDPDPELLVVFQLWRAGHAVHNRQLLLTTDHLAMIKERRDIAAVDDALCALQLIEHNDLIPLQRRLRRLSWRLHMGMMALTPWVLDAMLLHPLGLWVGTKGREGLLFFPEAPVPELASASVGSIGDEGPKTQPAAYHRLQFGFGDLKGSDAESQFLHSWAILSQCLRYTPAPLDDSLYQLLFLDSDVFSWSQLCFRPRQVCRQRSLLATGLQRVSLDGTSLECCYTAGLGTASLGNEGEVGVSRLQQLIDSLDELRDRLSHEWDY